MMLVPVVFVVSVDGEVGDGEEDEEVKGEG